MLILAKTTTVRRALVAWIRDESGTTAVEYGLIAALVAVASLTAFHSLGQTIAGIFGDVADALERVNMQIR
jgi:pilus assembly protein Flp/PilA